MGKPRKVSESKKDEGKNGSSSGQTTSSSNEEEKAQMKKKEIAKGKKPVPVEVEMEDEIMSDVEHITQKAKGIVIREGQAPEAHTADDKSKAVVMSSYELRSGKKGRGVDTASENKPTDSEPKGRGKKRGRGLKRTVSLTSGLNELEFNPDLILTKRLKKGKGNKEEETDVLQGSETDPEEACRRINKGRNPGNDNDEDGAGGGAGAGAGTGADRAITA